MKLPTVYRGMWYPYAYGYKLDYPNCLSDIVWYLICHKKITANANIFGKDIYLELMENDDLCDDIAYKIEYDTDVKIFTTAIYIIVYHPQNRSGRSQSLQISQVIYNRLCWLYDKITHSIDNEYNIDNLKNHLLYKQVYNTIYSNLDVVLQELLNQPPPTDMRHILDWQNVSKTFNAIPDKTSEIHLLWEMYNEKICQIYCFLTQKTPRPLIHIVDNDI